MGLKMVNLKAWMSFNWTTDTSICVAKLSRLTNEQNVTVQPQKCAYHPVKIYLCMKVVEKEEETFEYFGLLSRRLRPFYVEAALNFHHRKMNSSYETYERIYKLKQQFGIGLSFYFRSSSVYSFFLRFGILAKLEFCACFVAKLYW